MEITGKNIWLEELRIGKESAYKALFEKYYFQLSSFACKYVEDQDTAEDIVQDVLYEFWLKKQSFETIISFKSYLYSAVRNRCLDVLRHRKVEIKYLAESTYNEETEFFLNQILEEELYVLLKDAIEALPQQTRDVYELALLGHDNTEIAGHLGLTADAVKSHKKRGKKLLQEKLKNLIYLFPFLP